MRHGSLFSGIGGFDLAAEWLGWENVFHCEWNDFGKRVLKYYWPDAISYDDITKTDFTIHRGNIDILTGGFPCQPYSSAGKRKGTEDDRHLWPEMLRAIREIQPSYVVGENVRGLTNWNGGLVFDQVQADLETEGFEVLPFLLPACALNAPHRRDRVWFIAHAFKRRIGELQSAIKRQDPSQIRIPDFNRLDIHGKSAITSNTNSIRMWNQNVREQQGTAVLPTNSKTKFWQRFPTVSPVCNGDDGFPGRLDTITFFKWREGSIQGGGNAIVPPLAYEIFKAIEKTEQQLNSKH